MSRSLFIDRGVMETRVAVIEDERIVEIHFEASDADQGGTQGAIRAARVTHINNDIQAATVDAGEGLSLFLRAADARTLAEADGPKRVPVAKLLKRGQNLLVQVGRSAIEDKQARCSTDIVLGGRYVVLHPMREGVETGKRPLPDSLIEQLTLLGQRARITVRPAAHMVDAAVVIAEVEHLLDQWDADSADARQKPGMLRSAPDLLHRAFTHLAGPEPEAILVPDRAMQSLVRQLANRTAPDLVDRVVLTGPQRSLDLDDEVDGALSMEIQADAKISLSFEATRAMTVIDIDGTGQPVDVNLAAVPEIARQLRLRRIGGPVAIDFVSMGRAPERKRVETALRQATQRDPEQVDIGTIDRFGICTLARRRSGRSLQEELLTPVAIAPALDAKAVLSRVLRRVEQELSQIGPLPMKVELSEQLHSAAPDDLQQRLVERLSRPLSLAFADRPVESFAVSRER